MEPVGASVFVVEWSGHVDVAGLRAHCDAIERAVEGSPGYLLLLDVTNVSGYDPDARAFALEWSATDTAQRMQSIAIVADSQLAIIDSPAAALAPPRRARVFGTRRAALAHVQSQALASSGEYPVVGAAAKAATAAARRSGT